MTTIRKYLFGILGAHIVLIVFFAAFKFEAVTIALYSGIWVGIGISMLLFWHASLARRVKLIVAIFAVQVLVFASLDFTRMNDLFLEEAGFLCIGVWGGILIGSLLNATKTLEERASSLERELALRTEAKREVGAEGSRMGKANES